MADSPQNLHLLTCAFVYTGAGQAKRPRLLIVDSQADGIDPKALVEEWLLSAKGQQAFTVVHDLRSDARQIDSSLARPSWAETEAQPAMRIEGTSAPHSLRVADEKALPDEGVAITNGKRS